MKIQSDSDTMKKFSLSTTLSCSQRNDNDENDDDNNNEDDEDDDNSDDEVMKKFSLSDSPDNPLLLPAKRQR